MQVTRQPDNDSCGVIVLKCIEQVLKFACRFDFNFNALVHICEGDIQYLSKPADIASFRQHVGSLLNAMYLSALRYETDCEGMIILFATSDSFQLLMYSMRSGSDNVESTEARFPPTASHQLSRPVSEMSTAGKTYTVSRLPSHLESSDMQVVLSSEAYSPLDCVTPTGVKGTYNFQDNVYRFQWK